MKKKIICVLLALVMLLALTSCFKSENKYDYIMADYITIPDFIGHEVEFLRDSMQASIDSQLLKYSKEYTVTVSDEIYVDVTFYYVKTLVDETTGKTYDQQGDKVEELSQTNMKLVVGSGKLGSYLENAILGSSIGNIINNKFPKNQLEDILPDITLPEGKVLNDYIENELFVDIKIMNKEIKLGDVVSVSYKGYLLDDEGNIKKNDKGEDEMFDESSATSFFLGSKLAIDDFENNIVGMFIGEDHSKEFLATFPEDYGDEKLNGETVLFRVYVKDLYVAPVYDNAFVKAYFKFDTTEDFENDLVRQYVIAAMYDYVLKECKIISYPTNEYNDAHKELKDVEASFKTEYGVELDTYIRENYSMSRDEYVKSNMKTEMIYYAISQQNGLIPTSEMLVNERSNLINYYKNYYMQNTSMSGDVAYDQAVSFVDSLGASYVYENVMFTLVDDFFKEKATIKMVDKTYTSISEILAGEKTPSEQ